MIFYNKCKVYVKMKYDIIYGEFFLMILFRLEVTFNRQDYQFGYYQFGGKVWVCFFNFVVG